MTEEEAQAALLAMGPRLEWRRIGTFWSHDGFDKDEASYTIAETSDDPQLPFRAVCTPEYLFAEDEEPEAGKTDKSYYQTLAEAKAACEVNCFAFDEVHAVTGAFPPSVEAVERA